MRGELKTERDCHTLTLGSSDHSSTSSSFCWAAQPGTLRGPSPLSGAGSHSAGILSPTGTATRTPTATATRTELKLLQAVCGTWLYNCLRPTCFLWAYASATNSTTSTSQGDIPISSTGCNCFLIDGSVEGQYVTGAIFFLLQCFLSFFFLSLFRCFPNDFFLSFLYIKSNTQ